MALVIGTPAQVPAPPQNWGGGAYPVPVSGARKAPAITPANVRIWPAGPVMISVAK